MRLNLLSPKKIKQIIHHLFVVSLQHFISLSLVAICMAGILLLIAKLIMQNSFNQAVTQSTLVTQEYGVLNQRVYLVNKKISFLNKIQKDYIVWSPDLAMLTKLVPKEIEIKTIDINSITKDLKIDGHADKREDLLIYKDQLEASPLITSVDLPLQSILEATDIDFSIKAKIKL